ncbi:MAG: hypothetical protein PHI06_02870 [Desulfobulbaceae bacterium]|nr:hypothetical protein [Desulfobulbaceae bacterium]
MSISNIETSSNRQGPLIAAAAKAVPCTERSVGQSFAAMLGCQLFSGVDKGVVQGGGVVVPSSQESASTSSGPNGLIPLGKIDRATPTISHLLTGSSTHREESWNIIFAAVNKEKQFASIRQGTEIYLDPKSNELLWGDALGSETSRSAPGQLPPLAAVDQASPADGGVTIDSALSDEKVSDSLIPLGAIDEKNPTLSHLLKKSYQYGDNAWNIIFSSVNRNKPYASVRAGSLVSINPKTLELSFDSPADRPARLSSRDANSGESDKTFSVGMTDSKSQQQFSEKLAESVKAYLGHPYREIDCYALVVKGLKDQGVRYSGSGGLRNRLERMAARHGLPRNAYQNGEGLIEVAGNKLYDQSFIRVKDAEGQSSKVMEQLQPLLQEGMLLSFSTPSRGHTGVVARRDGQWTYVNSGVIDHQINGGVVSKRVGEEKLEEEIKNWFLLAKNKRTSLKVSAGLFDTEKLKGKGRMLANTVSEGKEMI